MGFLIDTLISVIITVGAGLSNAPASNYVITPTKTVQSDEQTNKTSDIKTNTETKKQTTESSN